MIVDAHLHVPDIFDVDKMDTVEVRGLIIGEMDRAGVDVALVYSLEVNPKLVLERITLDRVFKGLEDTISYGNYSLPPSLLRTIENLEDVLVDHSNVLKTVFTPSERVIKLCKDTNRLKPVGSVDLSLGDEALERVESLLAMGAVGIKILPTVQVMEEKEMNVLDAAADILEDHARILFIHTGCDPGIWELPNLCSAGNPKNFEGLIGRHRDLPVVLCHMGSYSALRPGIYLEEALELTRRYDNVYLDTAAVEPQILLKAYSKVGPNKILFGSDYPLVGYELKELVGNVARLPIPQRDRERILGLNTLDLLDGKVP